MFILNQSLSVDTLFGETQVSTSLKTSQTMLAIVVSQTGFKEGTQA